MNKPRPPTKSFCPELGWLRSCRRKVIIVFEFWLQTLTIFISYFCHIHYGCLVSCIVIFWYYVDLHPVKGATIYYLHHRVLSIYRGHFSSNNARNTPIARPLGRGNGCRSWVQIWSKFYHCNCIAVWIIVPYITAIYRGFIVSDE